MKRIFFLLFFHFLSFLYAQQISFTQGIFSALTNPAHLNIHSEHAIQTHYRSQWTTLSNGYRSMALRGEYFAKPMNTAFGISLQQQKIANLFLTTQFHGYYAYRIELNPTLKLQFGGAIGYLQNKTDYDQLIFEDQINPFTGNVTSRQEQFDQEPTQHFFDAGFGTYLFSKHYELGLFAKHFTQSVTYYPLAWGIQAKYYILLDKQKGKQVTQYRISPLLAYQHQGINQTAFLGVEGNYENVIVSVIYQSQEFQKATALSFLIGLEQNHFQFAYNFDLNLLNQEIGNTHEIRVGYLMK